MNALEIEDAVSDLAELKFDSQNFPYLFLQAFGNKETTIKKLKSGASNKSDIPGAILQANNIHIISSKNGEVKKDLMLLKGSSNNQKFKVKYVLATDGESFESEDLNTGEIISCSYEEFSDHFGFFLSLAGISTVKQIRENTFDIKATNRLNKLYLELQKNNPSWIKTSKTNDINHFMARLIFCFFAEDTEIFKEKDLFVNTVQKMSDRNSSNTHEVIAEIFRAMNTDYQKRENENISKWAKNFPYVNGGLFEGDISVPTFTKIARSYLFSIGSLDWTKINPDIFGSMIQAIADEEERDHLGMHYTSVPNILKVLNPLFLDSLKNDYKESLNNPRKLINLRNKISKIRVFDPACGSGNFLVIAYKELREIENKINHARDEKGRRSEIPLTNFRGIELKSFSSEIARLALIIAEYQCNQLYIGQKQALDEFLPLDKNNWIICGNALSLDWFSICSPNNKSSKILSEDLFDTTNDLNNIDYENEDGEIYICGNPPFKGSQDQTKEQKNDLLNVFKKYKISHKQIDYVGAWFLKTSEYISKVRCKAALVSTNSLCQGRLVSILWPVLFKLGVCINFAYTSFKWFNLAKQNAGVIVIILGLSSEKNTKKYIYTDTANDSFEVMETTNITPYLTPGDDFIIKPHTLSISKLPEMSFGNMALDGGNLILSNDEVNNLDLTDEQRKLFIRRLYGADEFINGKIRYCLWINDEDVEYAKNINSIRNRIDLVRKFREESSDKGTNDKATIPYQFRENHGSKNQTIIVPRSTSETRDYLPVGLVDKNSVVTDACCAIYDGPLWCISLIASRVHLVWTAIACGKLKTDYRYSKTLGWNAFPFPELTEKNKADLTKCAEEILLSREENFPMSIGEMYKPGKIPFNLLEAHKHNDEIVERILIGRKFKNDTERVLKLVELYKKLIK